MAYDIAPTVGILGALSQYGQVNRQNALLEEQRRRERQRMLGAIAGIGLGAVAGPAAIPGLGAVQGAALGAQAGGAFASGDPVGVAQAGLGAAAAGQAGSEREANLRAGMGVAGAIRQMQAPVIPMVGAQGTAADLSPVERQRNALLGAFASVAPTNPALGLQGALALRPPPPKPLVVPQGAAVQQAPGQPFSIPAPAGGAAPAGYRLTASGNLEAIPGGPADPAIKPKEDPFFGGKGVGVSDSRNLMMIGPLIANGTATPEQIDAYTVSYARTTRPQIETFTEDNGTVRTIQRPPLNLPPARFPAPPGWSWEASGQGGAGGAAGVVGATTLGTTGKPVPMESAAKLASMQVAQKEMQAVRGAYIGKDGKIDQTMVASAWASMPKTQGREVKQRLERAIEAKLRADSGAAVPPSEVARYLRLYLPSPFDSDQSNVNKLDALQAYLGGAIDLATFARGLPSALESSKGGSDPMAELRKKYSLVE